MPKYENNQSTFDDLYFNRRNCESNVLDYKKEFHFGTQRQKLELTKDIVSFANANGGCIVFGVTDSYVWEGLDDGSDDYDDIQIHDFIRKYIDREIDFEIGT